MSRGSHAIALLALLALGQACAAKTQRPHRTGLWGEIAAGGGRMRMTCSTCAEPINAPGGAGLVRIGGTLSDRVFLGWESAGFIDESFGFTSDDSSTIAEMETVGVVALWFPWRSGAFFKGGFGVVQGRFTISSATGQVDSTKGTGIGMTFGVGWDVPIARKYAITANAATFITAIGDILLPGRRVDDVIGSLFQVSVGFTFR